MVDVIIEEKLKVRWHVKTRSHYEAIKTATGKDKYPFSRFGDYFEVDIEDAFPGASNKITIKCDYCGEREEKIYRNWRVHFDKSPVKKDACRKCRGKKTKESNMVVYGVSNVMHIEEHKNKMEETNLERYGTRNAGGSVQSQEKAKQTCSEKYGKEHYFQTEEFKSSYKNTMQSKYGVDNAFQAEEIKEKSKDTMMKNWGVEHNMQNPEIRNRAVQTMYEKSTTPTSKPQLYLHDVYGGELNYPFERYNLDIALPDEKIVVEYDGGAHDLKVTLGGITQKEFDQRAIIRGTYLKTDGWKLITIKSKRDSLPNQNTLLKMLRDARAVFNQGRSWVNFCIDEGTIEYRNTKNEYDYDKLLKYKEVLRLVE